MTAVDPAEVARRNRRMAAWRRAIVACEVCRAADPRITDTVPGEGSRFSPVVLVGQAPAPKCAGVGPFTGGSGELIDEALWAAGRRDRAEVFITNAVHCLLPDHRKPRKSEINTHRPLLRGELEVVSPLLVIGMGDPARESLQEVYPDAPQWTPRCRPSRSLGLPVVLYVKHPNRIRQWERAERPEYVRRLAAAIRWAFRAADA